MTIGAGRWNHGDLTAANPTITRRVDAQYADGYDEIVASLVSSGKVEWKELVALAND